MESESQASQPPTPPEPAHDEPAEPVPTSDTTPAWAHPAPGPTDGEGDSSETFDTANEAQALPARQMAKGDPDWSHTETPAIDESKPDTAVPMQKSSPAWAQTVPTSPGDEPAAAPLLTDPPRAVAEHSTQKTWPPAEPSSTAPPVETDVWPPEPPTESMPAWPPSSEMTGAEPPTAPQPAVESSFASGPVEEREPAPPQMAEAAAGQPAGPDPGPAMSTLPLEAQPGPEAARPATVPPSNVPAATIPPTIEQQAVHAPQAPATEPPAHAGTPAPTPAAPAGTEPAAAQPPSQDHPTQPPRVPSTPQPSRPPWAPAVPEPPAQPPGAKSNPPGPVPIPAWAPRISPAPEPAPPAQPQPASWQPAPAPQPQPVVPQPAPPRTAPTPPVAAVPPAVPAAGQLPVAQTPVQPKAAQPQASSWEIVDQRRNEAEDKKAPPAGPTPEDRSYAEWFAWAKRGGAPASACHAAAQGAFEALSSGKDLATAVQWATAAMSRPPAAVSAARQAYCAWFSLANIDLNLDQPRAHNFAAAAVHALDSGQDANAAHAAGLAAVGVK